MTFLLIPSKFLLDFVDFPVISMKIILNIVYEYITLYLRFCEIGL